MGDNNRIVGAGSHGGRGPVNMANRHWPNAGSTREGGGAGDGSYHLTNGPGTAAGLNAHNVGGADALFDRTPTQASNNAALSNNPNFNRPAFEALLEDVANGKCTLEQFVSRSPGQTGGLAGAADAMIRRAFKGASLDLTPGGKVVPPAEVAAFYLAKVRQPG